jgi:hypothetical protein
MVIGLNIYPVSSESGHDQLWPRTLTRTSQANDMGRLLTNAAWYAVASTWARDRKGGKPRS